MHHCFQLEKKNEWCFSGDLYRIMTPVFRGSSIIFQNGADGRARRQLYDKSLHHENLNMYATQLHKVSGHLVK
jgi:cytochrome P450